MPKRKDQSDSTQRGRKLPGKRVHWDSSVVEQEKSVMTDGTPAFFKEPKKEITIKYVNKVIKSIVGTYGLGPYPELSSYGITDSELNEIFQKHSISFYCKAIFLHSCSTLPFLIEKIPLDSLRIKLRDKNFDLLNKFLKQAEILQEIGYYTPKEQQLRIETFKLLLKIDNEGIKKFMASHCISELAQHEYEQALSLSGSPDLLL